MKLKFSACLTLLFLLLVNINNAQIENDNKINYLEFNGKVVNSENKEPLVFANINLIGSNVSTISNSDGDFTLKIPKSFSPKKIKISFIGFKTKIIDLSSYDNINKPISLDVFVSPLSETVISIPKNVEQLVRETLINSNKNYLPSHNIMTAFYRETIKRKRRNVSLSEAVVDIYKSPYEKFEKKEVIKVLKVRKDTDYTRLDTLALKLSGGPYNTLFQDIIKYPNYFIPLFYVSNYTFWVHRTSEINKKPVYVIRFRQKDDINEPLFYGELFIDGKNKVLLSANYSLNVSDREKSSKLFVAKKPRHAKVWPTKANFRVDYSERNGKWYYNYSNLTLDFKVNSDKKIFNTTYSLSSEMVITDWKENTSLDYPKRKEILKSNVILTDSKLGFSDKDFWGINNIIEPENTIENAIKKIKRKLKRLKN